MPVVVIEVAGGDTSIETRGRPVPVVVVQHVISVVTQVDVVVAQHMISVVTQVDVIEVQPMRLLVVIVRLVHVRRAGHEAERQIDGTT